MLAQFPVVESLETRSVQFTELNFFELHVRRTGFLFLRMGLASQHSLKDTTGITKRDGARKMFQSRTGLGDPQGRRSPHDT